MTDYMNSKTSINSENAAKTYEKPVLMKKAEKSLAGRSRIMCVH